ncbi:hypothetical protein GY45DRAFT_995699 [Cubamyces sp. BRFM 1775]|nr:hypothetical protein GY45DRAFT_995699 [Cubamyces sp. BRFM 1775]
MNRPLVSGICTEYAVHDPALHRNAGVQKPHSRCGGYASGSRAALHPRCLPDGISESDAFVLAPLNCQIGPCPYPCSSLGVSGQYTPKFPRQHAHSPQSLCPHPPRWTRIAPCQLSFCNTTTTL